MSKAPTSSTASTRQSSRAAAPRLSSAQIKALIEDQTKPVLVLVVPELVRRERVLQVLRAAFEVAGNKKAGAINLLDGKSLNAGALRNLSDRLSTLSLFSARALYIVQSVEDCTAENCKALVALIQAQAKASDPPARLVLCAAALPAVHALRKAAKSADVLVEMPALQGAELESWAAKELARQGIKRYPQTLIGSMLRAAEDNVDLLHQMIEQLALYVDGEEATQADFTQLFPQNSVPSEYEVADLLCAPQAGRYKAQLFVHRLLASGVREFLFLSLLQRTFSQLLRIRCLQDAHTPTAVIQSEIGLPPWIFNKQAQIAARYTSSGLHDRLRAILRADSALKNTSLGSDTIFAELAQRLGP